LNHTLIENSWLNDNQKQSDILQIINNPFNEEEIEAFTVSKDLFNPRINSNTIEITQPVTYEKLEVDW